MVTLFVGRLHQQKGLELLQAEIDRLAPSNSNRRLLLWETDHKEMLYRSGQADMDRTAFNYLVGVLTLPC